jgi:hypothetical protein
MHGLSIVHIEQIFAHNLSSTAARALAVDFWSPGGSRSPASAFVYERRLRRDKMNAVECGALTAGNVAHERNHHDCGEAIGSQRLDIPRCRPTDLTISGRIEDRLRFAYPRSPAQYRLNPSNQPA